MKLQTVVIVISALIISASTSAQVVSKDSISSLKQQKEAIQISKKLNDRKLELAKLENSLDKKSRDAQTAADDAQKSADVNGQAASKLSTDPQDKKLAREASKSAKSAKRDARQARKAAASLDDLKKNIESLKGKISDDEAKLATMSNSVPPAVQTVEKN